MSTNKYTGKDLDEAINHACSSLEVTRDQLDIQVVAPGSTGILGLFRKKAIIRATKKNDSSGQGSKPGPKSQKKRERSTAKPFIPKENTPRPSRAPLKDATPEVLAEIKSATEKILSLMGYPAEASLSQEQGKVLVQISGDHIEAIIGPEGNNLDALQYLVRKIVSQKFADKVMLSMDADNFRETRKEELRELALEIARIVKEGGKSRIIAPLNPAERRIIHVALQNDKTIRSKSIGEGLFKKIKVYIPGQGRSRSGKRRPQNPPKSAAANKE